MPKPSVKTEFVGAIPIIKHYTDRFRVIKIIDSVIPSAPQRLVTHGECVLAMLISLLQGDHRLCHVWAKFQEVDLEKLFGRGGIEASHFNDTRLGDTLDVLYSNTSQIYGNIISQTLREFNLKPSRLHLDSTSVVLRGVYDVLEILQAFLEPPPIPTYGYSKDHRPDLPQMILGMVTTEDGIPIMGRFENGNRSDDKLFYEYMHELAANFKELGTSGAILVGDSKLCSVETIAQAAVLNFPLITMMPNTFSIRKDLVEKASQKKNLPLLMTTNDKDTYHGMSVDIPHLIKHEGKADNLIPLRALVIYSSQLANKKKKTKIRQENAEAKKVETFAKNMSKIDFACEKDAKKIVAKEWKGLKAKSHTIQINVKKEKIETIVRSRGRPSKKNPGKKSIKIVYRAEIIYEKIEQIKTHFDKDGFFVLVTSILNLEDKSDLQLLEAYKGQNVVETSFKWLKGPLAVSPVFLELPTRIQSLSLVFMLALLFAATIQRLIRKAADGKKVPNYYNQRSDKPTWIGLLALFEKIRITNVRMSGEIYKTLHHLETDQKEILSLLKFIDLYDKYVET